jgi:predicted ester cyclase
MERSMPVFSSKITPSGKTCLYTKLGMVSTTFPDLHFTIENMIAEGDFVAVRHTARGTHQGNFRGIPPAGKQVIVTGVIIDRVANGKIIEEWGNQDWLGLLQQLGVIPAMG